ncbi:MAG: acetyl-CoA decarbonylase/synthase complex subunit alpha [Chloroflexi bacterium]|nr:acetyl-CoA decarbonylase/synthase complex subunit alpha [Chloroflexota bacterium]
MLHDCNRIGTTPRPGVADLRPWDRILLARYRPTYRPVSSDCTLCALGPCNLEKNRLGACGQNLQTFLARETLLLATMGASAHATQARDITEQVIAERGPDLSLDLGPHLNIRTPIVQLVVGTRPTRLAHLRDALDYVEGQLVRLLAATHFGGESDPTDLESKTLHAGTMDLVALEVADIAQTVAYHYPAGPEDNPVVPLGLHAIDRSKPVILCLGHHAAVGHEIVRLRESLGLAGEIEVAGLCCAAHDMARSDPHSVTVVGNLRDQLLFARAGVADVIVADQQCIRLDLKDEALRAGSFFIATSPQALAGLPDDTGHDPTDLAEEMVHRTERASFVTDPTAAAHLALALAKRGKCVADPLPLDAPVRLAAPCTACGLCTTHCPLDLPVAEAVAVLARDDDVTRLEEIARCCVDCGRCDAACPWHIPVMALIGHAGRDVLPAGQMRVGRGPITDFEIKRTGPSIVLGDIPGIVAFLACPDYPDGRERLAWMAQTLAARGYIVITSGCAAIDLGRSRDYPTLYQTHDGAFDQGGLVNLGSCVSTAHAIGAAIKIANIFLHRPLSGNYAEIADYILNRVGMVGVLWGGITPKALATSAGANRLGIPVIFGPQGANFRRTLPGDLTTPQTVYDARTGERVPTGGPVPESLFTVAQTGEEALLQAVKLCFRANDTAAGRRTKLDHYLALHKSLRGTLPADLLRWVRMTYDIPRAWSAEVRPLLERNGWQSTPIPDPTLLPQLVRGPS